MRRVFRLLPSSTMEIVHAPTRYRAAWLQLRASPAYSSESPWIIVCVSFSHLRIVIAFHLRASMFPGFPLMPWAPAINSAPGFVHGVHHAGFLRTHGAHTNRARTEAGCLRSRGDLQNSR